MKRSDETNRLIKEFHYVETYQTKKEFHHNDNIGQIQLTDTVYGINNRN